MLGECLNCKQFGHKASQCRNNPDGKGLPGVDEVKKAGAETVAKGKLSKAARCRQNKVKRREEEAKQQAETDAIKKAFETFQVSSYTEEDLPKNPAHSARQTRLVGGHSRSLFKELNQIC